MDYWWQSDASRTLTVFEDAPEPIDTGLLNADGTKIYRHRKMAPIGFDLSGKALDCRTVT
jgi:hypothetical protein